MHFCVFCGKIFHRKSSFSLDKSIHIYYNSKLNAYKHTLENNDSDAAPLLFTAHRIFGVYKFEGHGFSQFGLVFLQYIERGIFYFGS